ncbi:ABC transporter substrate-binding protein [Nocardioides humi]|uniref:Fe/B12 periplasmic-binding domain-containing protein n=1 Tax=Nocardioides humi TaxID=449461 RepID=A0ABN2AA62_9ACTN|nr:ABC transporter substrate-binding protein [Nocardioides humi]
MRKSTRLAALAPAALLAASLLAACGASDAADEADAADAARPPSGSITVTDDTGTEITLDAPATRIACLTMICVDALTEVGITPVAYREALALDERYAGPDADMREITGGFGEENVEDIALATPDLVIGLAGAQDGLRAAVEAHAPLFLVEPRSWRDSVAFLRTVGELTGTEDAAEERASGFVERVEAAAENRSELTTLSMYGEPGSLGVDSVETPVGSLLAEVSDYPWPAGDDPFASVAVEQIAAVDPDVIFAQAFSPSVDTEPLGERLAADPIWAGLGAARAGRVVEVEAAVWATGRGTISLGLVLDAVEKNLSK